MSVGDILRVTAQFAESGTNIAQWVWHYRQSSGGTVDLDDFVAEVITNLGIAWALIEADVVDTVAGDTVEVALWDTVLNQFNTMASGDISALVGTEVIADMLPHESAPFVKFFTAVGRSIGKKKLYGYAEDTQDASIIEVAALARMVTFALAFHDDLIDGFDEWKPGNFSLPLEIFRDWNKTVSAAVLMGSQYSRKPGIGL